MRVDNNPLCSSVRIDLVQGMKTEKDFYDIKIKRTQNQNYLIQENYYFPWAISF